MSVELIGKRGRRELLTRHRLARLRRVILTRLRAAFPAQTAQIDAVQTAYQAAWDKLARQQQLAQNGGAGANTIVDQERAQAAVKWLAEELQLLQALIPLGALAGGERPCAVMLEYRERVTRAQTKAVMDRVEWCDRNWQPAPIILIAPFTGRGIYEWDRDSLVISLQPVAGAEDAVANAVANSRMMLDSLHYHARLKTLYQTQFPAQNFQRNFQQDYRAWLCQAAKGNAENLPPEKLQFFITQVAPEFFTAPAFALAPRELKPLTPPQREILRHKIQQHTARDSWRMRWHLGTLFWLDGKIPEALQEFTNAANLAPQELYLFMGVALLLIKSKKFDQARQILGACLVRGRKTIWAIYAPQVIATLPPIAADKP